MIFGIDQKGWDRNWDGEIDTFDCVGFTERGYELVGKDIVTKERRWWKGFQRLITPEQQRRAIGGTYFDSAEESKALWGPYLNDGGNPGSAEESKAFWSSYWDDEGEWEDIDWDDEEDEDWDDEEDEEDGAGAFGTVDR